MAPNDRFIKEDTADIWDKLYNQAKKEYHPEDVTPFIHAHNVVCALESADGTIIYRLLHRGMQRRDESVRGARSSSEYVCQQRPDEDQTADCLSG